MSLTVQLVRDRLCMEWGIPAGVPRAAFAEYGGRRTAMDSQIINRHRKRPGRLLLADIRRRPLRLKTVLRRMNIATIMKMIPNIEKNDGAPMLETTDIQKIPNRTAPRAIATPNSFLDMMDNADTGI